MGERTLSIEFTGYWPDWRKDLLRAWPGIYCVYECTHTFPFDRTIIKLAGKIDLLNPAFVVNRI